MVHSKVLNKYQCIEFETKIDYITVVEIAINPNLFTFSMTDPGFLAEHMTV